MELAWQDRLASTISNEVRPLADSNIVSGILAEFIAAMKKDGSLPKEIADTLESSVTAGRVGHADTVRAVTELSRRVTRED